MRSNSSIETLREQLTAQQKRRICGEERNRKFTPQWNWEIVTPRRSPVGLRIPADWHTYKHIHIYIYLSKTPRKGGSNVMSTVVIPLKGLLSPNVCREQVLSFSHCPTKHYSKLYYKAILQSTTTKHYVPVSGILQKPGDKLAPLEERVEYIAERAVRGQVLTSSPLQPWLTHSNYCALCLLGMLRKTITEKSL